MEILVFGDVMGRVGRRALAAVLPAWKKAYAPDLVIANGENLAHGKGVTESTAQELFDAGVHLLTGGNHTFEGHGAMMLAHPLWQDRVLRPDNYPSDRPGKGVVVLDVGGTPVLVVNLLCRVKMRDGELVADPFAAFDRIVAAHPEAKIVLVDLHGEITSERVGFGWHAAGRAAAVWGTHTHVPTADTRLLPPGTAFQTDVGMTGFADGIIGIDKAAPLSAFRNGEPLRGAEMPENGYAVVNALRLTVDPATGRATHVERLQEYVTI
ncbi:YmdB family metallophosphoesterase [Patescibacteria group bacterium]|nr:MAG: YmdB family metallophosphoesterase [Patescibacteria group bacterium]